MGAYRCILTHFSQRYPKWPEGVGQQPAVALAEEAGPAAGPLAGVPAAVAFDGMRVPLALLPVLPALMPAVQAALADADKDAPEAGHEVMAAAAGDAQDSA